MSAPSGTPEISFVIPVYNKAGILPLVLQALAGQELGVPAEYIFVDDASNDESPAVLEAHIRNLPAVTILRNTQNAGPSRRLNQGAAKARGRYLCLIDADELIIPDAVAIMHRLMQERQADMIHAKVEKSEQDAADIRLAPLGHIPDVVVSDRPLYSILHGRGFVRMAWLIETALFRAAGGCDERLFIQDESLPLRLAAKAHRFIDFRGSMTHAPRIASHLSADKRQQHHDRFFAYYNFLQDTPLLPKDESCRIAETCVSVTWKAQRRDALPLGMRPVLQAYLKAKLGLGVSPAFLGQAAAAFCAMPGIRRPRAMS